MMRNTQTTITLQLPPHIERRLRTQATNRGLELSDFVVETLSRAAGPEEAAENQQEEDSPWRGVFTVTPNRDEFSVPVAIKWANPSASWNPEVVLDQTIQ